MFKYLLFDIDLCICYLTFDIILTLNQPRCINNTNILGRAIKPVKSLSPGSW